MLLLIFLMFLLIFLRVPLDFPVCLYRFSLMFILIFPKKRQEFPKHHQGSPQAPPRTPQSAQRLPKGAHGLENDTPNEPQRHQNDPPKRVALHWKNWIGRPGSDVFNITLSSIWVSKSSVAYWGSWNSIRLNFTLQHLHYRNGLLVRRRLIRFRKPRRGDR